MESTLNQSQFPHRISLSQAAQLSGYHQDYLGQLCRIGKLRAAKIGRNWYTTQSELQSLVNNSEAYGLLNQALSNADQSDQIDQPQVEHIELRAPVIASNYVISEVQDMPIKLEEDRLHISKSHHTLQTLITRMKLEELKTEVLQVTGLIGEISDEVANHTQILNRHEKILSMRSDLRHAYSPNLAFGETPKPVVSMIEYNLDTPMDSSVDSTKVLWVWPAFTLVLALIVSTLLILNNNLTDTQPQISTVIYKTPTPQVAGDTIDQVSPTNLPLK